MEKKIVLDTPLGKLCAVSNAYDKWSEIFIYIERGDGLEIDLVSAEVDAALKTASAYLYEDTSTEQWTKKHTWTQKEIEIDADR